MHPCTARPQRMREWWPSKFGQGTEYYCLRAITIPHPKAVFWESTLMKLLRTLFFVLVIRVTSSNLLNTFFLLSNHDDLNILQLFHLFLHLTTHWSAVCFASHKTGYDERRSIAKSQRLGNVFPSKANSTKIFQVFSRIIKWWSAWSSSSNSLALTLTNRWWSQSLRF